VDGWAEGVLSLSPHMFDDPLPAEGLDLIKTLSELEERLTLEALERCNGNVSAAARLLRMKRVTLAMRLRVRGLPDGRRGRAA